MLLHYVGRWGSLYIPSWLLKLLPRWHVALTLMLVEFVSQVRKGCRYAKIEKALSKLRDMPLLMISGEREGDGFSADFMKGSKRVAKGDEITVMLQGQLFMKAKFTLDPSKTPKTIDYSVTGGPYAGKTQLGIYELDGDKVKFCFSTPGKERPTDFTTKANDGRTLSIWKREKK